MSISLQPGRAEGYQGGEANAMAEAGWGAARDSEFFKLSDWGKDVLGGGEAVNKTNRTLRAKPEGDGDPFDLKPDGDEKSDGVYDADRPGLLFPISDGMRAVFRVDGSVQVGFTARAQLFAAVPGGLTGITLMGIGKNQWVDMEAFLSGLYNRPAPDHGWDKFLTSPWFPQ